MNSWNIKSDKSIFAC